METRKPKAKTKAKTKKANSEGSIYQRASDGRWVCSVTLGWEGGKRKRKVLYGDTRAEVHAKKIELLRTMHTGGVVSTSKDTVEGFMERWLQHLRDEDRLRARTIIGYEQYSRLYIVPGLGKVKLAKLTPEDVQAWLNARKPAGRTNAGRTAKGGRVSARTMHHARAVLRRALKQAVRWGLVDRNVAESTYVDAPRIEKQEAVFLAADEARALLAASVGHRYEAAIACMLSMGLRPAEALGLVWWNPARPERGGVDLEAGVLRLRGALYRDRQTKAVSLAPLKTERSRRDLPIPAPALEALKRRRAEQNRERMANRRVWNEPIPGLVSTTALGAPLDEAHTRRALHALSEQAGIRKVHPYALRHTAATLARQSGTALFEVSRQLGHSTIAITSDTYSHVVPELMEEVAARMSALLSSRTS